MKPGTWDRRERKKARGEVAMLTGNSEAIAQPVADELDIGHYSAEVFPRYKDQKILKQQKAGKMVEMDSIGINDASALTRADFGIAIDSGTDVAFEAAGIILVKINLLDVVKTFTLIKASYCKMIQNLTSAIGYNLIALPLAARFLAHCLIVLSPADGDLLLSLLTIIAAIYAEFLRRSVLTEFG